MSEEKKVQKHYLRIPITDRDLDYFYDLGSYSRLMVRSRVAYYLSAVIIKDRKDFFFGVDSD